MKSPAWPLQQAIVARIRAATSYTVDDNVPEQSPYPYIKFGDVQARDWSDKSSPGQEFFVTLHFWSQYPGKKECAEMMDTVLQKLTGSWKPDLSHEFNVVHHGLDGDGFQIMDDDVKTKHGILRLKFFIEEL